MKINILIFLFLLNGCATIITGAEESILFSADVDEVHVRSGGYYCLSPCKLRLRKGQEHSVLLTKKGYKSETIQLENSFNPVALLNFFGLFGWIADFGSGAVWKSRYPSYTVIMKKE